MTEEIISKYASEEVQSDYGYSSGYTKPKPVHQQIKIIHELFCTIKWGYFRPNEDLINLPDGAEGLFAIPRWEKVAPTYGEAVEKVLDMINEIRNGEFRNYRRGRLNSRQFRQSKKSVMIFQKLGHQQEEYDILVAPAQFGIRHRGRSIRRAREIMGTDECGLDAFAVGIMLLTHPERVMCYEDLWIDCPGDEFAPTVNGGFSESSFFRFGGNGIRFGTSGMTSALSFYGSASIFLP